MVYTVPFEELEEWLSTQPDNTRDTPYELNILNLTEERLKDYTHKNTLASILMFFFAKYVDLRSTKIPDTVKTLDRTFFEIGNVVYSFDIPEGVENLLFTYSMCGLKEPPQLPNSIINITGAFSESSIPYIPELPPNIKDITMAFLDCRKLKECKWLPDGIENTSSAFARCSNLEEAYVPENVRNVYGMFQDCDNLTKITIRAKAEDVLTLCGNDEELATLVEGRVLYVEDTQMEQYRKYYKYFGLTSPTNVLETENKITSFIELIKDAKFITANPSDEEYTITISSKTKVKTVNFWNYKLEGHFTNVNGRKFPESLISADLSGINFRSVKNYSYMFFYCTSLRKIVFPKMTISNCELIRAFAGCSSLSQIDMTQVEIRTPINAAEMFSLDKITVFYNPKKWDIKPHTYFGNATKAKFIPVEEIENKVEVNNKQIGTFYHNNQQYDKMIKGNNAYYLDNYKYLFGENNGEIDTNSAWGEMAEDGFEAWIF